MSSAQAEELEDWQIDADEAAEKIERAKEAEDGNYSASAAPRVKKAKAGPRLSLAEKVAKLEELLKRAEAYAQFMNENMEEDEDEEGGGGASSSSSSSPGGTKRKRDSSEAPPQEDGGVHQGPNGALNALTGTLHDYQVEGVLWLTRLFENGSHGILADEMGLGKTIQVIGLLTFMRHVGVKGPFIIVAPLSTIQNWCNEIEKWSGGTMSCVKYHGSKAERPGIMRRFMPTSSQSEASFPIVVTSYEMVKMDLEKLCRYKWKMCVVDEGHALKNSSCQLFAALKRLAGIEGCTRLLLTGTPLQNNLQELWSLLNFLLPEQFVDVDTFLAWFDMMQGGSADEVMEQEKTDSLVSKLHRILTPFVLRRTKLGVLPPDALPPKREVVVFCGMTQPQRWLYGAIHTHRLHDAMKQAATIGLNVVGKKMGNGTRGIPSMQNKMMQLRKCCMHPYLFFEPTASGETDENIVQFSGKMIILDRIMRHCKAGGHRVLIFSQVSANDKREGERAATARDYALPGGGHLYSPTSLPLLNFTSTNTTRLIFPLHSPPPLLSSLAVLENSRHPRRLYELAQVGLVPHRRLRERGRPRGAHAAVQRPRQRRAALLVHSHDACGRAGDQPRERGYGGALRQRLEPAPRLTGASAGAPAWAEGNRRDGVPADCGQQRRGAAPRDGEREAEAGADVRSEGLGTLNKGQDREAYCDGYEADSLR